MYTFGGFKMNAVIPRDSSHPSVAQAFVAQSRPRTVWQQRTTAATMPRSDLPCIDRCSRVVGAPCISRTRTIKINTACQTVEIRDVHAFMSARVKTIQCKVQNIHDIYSYRCIYTRINFESSGGTHSSCMLSRLENCAGSGHPVRFHKHR